MQERNWQQPNLSRRAFVGQGSMVILGAGMTLGMAADLFAEDADPALRIGLITDMHYADKPPVGTRYYRESLKKLQQAATQFKNDQPDLVVQLGDFIDAADSVEVERGYLATIHKLFATLPGKKHHVLGNHCVYTLTKSEFLKGVEQEKSHYSFDASGFHFVILDSCFRADGEPYGRNNFTWTDANIPAEQIEWLAADLAETKHKTIVFVHQRLDVTDNHSVKNASAVRKVLEQSEKVIAVFQGHSHQNSVQEIAGIPYCVLSAMIEGSGKEKNSFATLDIHETGAMKVTGHFQQANYQWDVERKK